MSRKDISWTRITGSDMILSWSVFPAKKPVDTFPAAAYVEKPHPLTLGMCIPPFIGAGTRSSTKFTDKFCVMKRNIESITGADF